jgi:5-methylcytosine-specific restriction endonuclease McrA
MTTVIDEETGEEFILRRTPEYDAEIGAHYSGWCRHPTTELRRRTIAGGRIAYWHQCQTCGSFPGNAVSKPDAADRIPDADTMLKDRYDARREAERHDIQQRHVRRQKRASANWWCWYDGYLNSPAWAAKRRAVMERAQGRCEGCRSRPAVHVHHLTYTHVGHEFLWELVVACDECHQRCHPDKQEHTA